MIKTFLFDLGNVLIRFSHDKMFEQMGSLLETTPSNLRELFKTERLIGQIDRGSLGEEGFHEILQNRFERRIDLEQLRQAASDIFFPNEEMADMPRRLKELGYRLVLLSNTSQTHIEWIRKTETVLEPFDDLILSYEHGLLKPESEMYGLAATRIGCEPEECFYTDDIPEFVATAKTLGFQGTVFVNQAQWLADVRALGIDLC